MNGTKDINLLPEKYLQSIELKNLLRRIVVCAAIIFLLTILTVITVSFANSYIEGKIEQYESLSQAAKYNESDKVYKEVQRNREQKQKGETVLYAVDSSNIGANEISTVLAQMPEGLYAISLSVDNNLRRIIFEGITEEQNAIVEYVETLNGTGLFKSVNLSKLATADLPALDASNRQTEFSLTLELGG